MMLEQKIADFILDSGVKRSVRTADIKEIAKLVFGEEISNTSIKKIKDILRKKEFPYLRDKEYSQMTPEEYSRKFLLDLLTGNLEGEFPPFLYDAITEYKDFTEMFDIEQGAAELPDNPAIVLTYLYNELEDEDNNFEYRMNIDKKRLELDYKVKVMRTKYEEDAIYLVVGLQEDKLPEVKVGDKKIKDTEYNLSNCSKKELRKLKEIVISEDTPNIKSSYFKGFTNLERVVIPRGIKSIRSYVFEDCINLKEVVLPKGLQSISFDSFRGCTALKSITLPISLTEIGYCAFADCTSLKDIYYRGDKEDWEQIDKDEKYSIPKHTTIHCADGDIQAKQDITEIVIPEGVKEIGKLKFVNYINLTKVVIPNSVTEIGYEAFYGCDSLKSITLPNSVTMIGYGAFNGCTSLTDIYYQGTREEWERIDKKGTSYIPEHTTIHYKDDKKVKDSKLTRKQKIYYAGKLEEIVDPILLRRNYRLKIRNKKEKK